MSFSLQKIIQAVLAGNAVEVREEVKQALSSGVDASSIIADGLVVAMDIVGQKFERNEIYVTDLIITSRAMHNGLKELKPLILADKAQLTGRAIIGTVQGDIHDIGKNLLGIMFEASGFEVIDLGVNVPPSTFVEAVIKHRPDVLCLSALLSSTLGAMADTITALQEAGLRKKVKIIVGGAPVNQAIALKIGADGYAPEATGAVKLVKDLIGAGPKRQPTLAPATLEFLLSKDYLADLQLAFTRLTGLHLVVVDATGNSLTPPVGFLQCSQHCDRFRDISATAIDVTTLAGNFKEAFIYRCHAGLVEISYPLADEDGTIGSVLCGHCLLEGDPLPAGQSKEDVPILTIKDLEAVCNLLSFTAGQIVQLNNVILTNKELEERRFSFIHFLKRQHQLEQALNEAELKALQSQVNPHFLFNTLNAIARLALFEAADATEKMTRALAQLMRYSLYQVKEIVTLAEEITAVRNYLFIQQTRFSDRIQSQVEFDDAILDARVPCMILQPLVENAIIHGLEPRENGGFIVVSGGRFGEQIHIEIKDDGVGIPPEIQKSIFDLQIRGSGKGQVSGLGIVNVYRRMQHRFGSSCALDVTSTPGKGTCVQLTFPYKIE